MHIFLQQHYFLSKFYYQNVNLLIENLTLHWIGHSILISLSKSKLISKILKNQKWQQMVVLASSLSLSVKLHFSVFLVSLDYLCFDIFICAGLTDNRQRGQIIKEYNSVCLSRATVKRSFSLYKIIWDVHTKEYQSIILGNFEIMN